jgi:hypothetical protein
VSTPSPILSSPGGGLRSTHRDVTWVRTRSVEATGCLAQRPGREADPEAGKKRRVLGRAQFEAVVEPRHP